MFDRLPLELIKSIIEYAVTQLLHSNRSSLVQLAQTSKGVYKILAPLLYHTIDASSHAAAFNRFLTNPRFRSLAQRILRHTRVLHIPRSERIHEYEAELLQGVEELTTGTVSVILTLGRWWNSHRKVRGGTLNLRRLTVVLAGFEEFRLLPASSTQWLTHVCAFGPVIDVGYHFASDPATWMRDILLLLPRLTHLGFNFWTRHRVTAIDLGPFSKAVRAALTFDRLEVIAIRVTDSYHSMTFLKMLLDLEDNRLRLWRDMGLGRHWMTAVCKGLRAEKTIWTEALPAQTLSAGASTGLQSQFFVP